MVALTKAAETHTRRVLVYGPPKVGKTLLVGKLAAHFDRVYWFDFDSGHSVLFNLATELQEKIELFAIPDNRDDPNALAVALKSLRGGPVEICQLHGKISCMFCKKATPPGEATKFELKALGPRDLVVYDALSNLSSSAMNQIAKSEADDYKFMQDDWGVLGKYLDMIIGFIKGAKNTNFVCISHILESDPKDKKKPSETFPLCGTRNFSRNVSKDFDDVVYMDVINGKHIAASSSTWRTSIKTGTRSQVALEKQAEPDLYDLWRSATAVA